jgi:hypothetical protein
LLIFSLNKITCTSPLHLYITIFWSSHFELIYFDLNCVFFYCLHFCPAH